MKFYHVAKNKRQDEAARAWVEQVGWQQGSVEREGMAQKR